MEFYEIDEFVKVLLDYDFTDYLTVFFQILIYGLAISVLVGFIMWGICSVLMVFKNIITK